jgi:hypothetical protein
VFVPGFVKNKFMSQSYCMNIIWLMKLMLVALTVSVSLNFATGMHPDANRPGKQVKGLIVVTDTTPTILFQK